MQYLISRRLLSHKHEVGGNMTKVYANVLKHAQKK
jgi:hypothetical protein